MTSRSSVALILSAAALALQPAAAAAQDFSWASALDASGDDIYVALMEPTVQFRQDGSLQPVLSLAAYYVWTREGDSKGLAPAVGFRYGSQTGSLLAKLGWGRTGTAVSRGSAPPPTMMMMSRAGRAAGAAARPASAAPAEHPGGGGIDHIGRQSGLTALVQGEFWGTGAWGSQAIASYSWGADVLWSRARLGRQVVGGPSGDTLTLGAELVWQLETFHEGPEPRYDAFHAGPVLQLTRDSGTVWGLSGGLKRVRTSGTGSWYARVELGLDL